MATGRRVAITGLGAITPIGNTVEDFWQGLIEGRNGVGEITQFDTEGYGYGIAAEVKDFSPLDHFDTKSARKFERVIQFAIIAARQALADSNLGEAKLDSSEIGCLMGVGIGGIEYIQKACNKLAEQGPRRTNPFLITKIIANAAPAEVAIDLGLRGPNMAVVTACAAGTNAIGEAAEMIRRGAATAMLAGGTESSICSVAVAGFVKMKAVCMDYDDPAKASRPFDANRSGFVMGEGAGALVLEDYEFAKARGANILAELTGYGLSCDAFHITAPAEKGEGSARAIRMAMKQTGLNLTDIGYINMHGTSTQLNDKFETAAIKTVFGEHAAVMPVSSIKSMIGHLLGAAGAVEAVATIKTLHNQLVPPTINYETPDPDCDLDYVPNEARKVEGLRHAMSNSLGFGGHNAAIVLSLDDSQ